IDAQIIVEGAVYDGIGTDERHFLRHHADIDPVAPQIAVAVYAEPVLAPAKQRDVALQTDVGSAQNERVVTRIGSKPPGAPHLAAGIPAFPRSGAVRSHSRCIGWRELPAQTERDLM